VLKFLAPILKRRKLKIKVETKIEAKQEVKVESQVESEDMPWALDPCSSSNPADTEEVSKKRKSPEIDDQDKKAQDSQPKIEQIQIIVDETPLMLI
jgi:hypothetical protein